MTFTKQPISPVCLFCLENVEDSENGDRESEQFIKQFIRFARSFLKVDNLDRLIGDLDNNEFTEKSLEYGSLFCEECHGVVESTMEAYKMFEDLRWRLLGKVVRLGGRIKLFGRKRSSYMIERHKEQLKSLAERLNVRRHCHLKVDLFRKQLATKCGLKARGILPLVVLNRSDANLSGTLIGNKENRCTTNTACIPPSYPLPSRESIHVFGSLMIIFSFGYGWDLEKIMEHYRPPPASEAHQVRTQESQPVTLKRRPGRPPKKRKIGPASAVTSLPPPKLAPPPPQIKRRPGRPPWKHLVNKKIAAPPQPPPMPPGPPVKRRPGRPPWKHLVNKIIAPCPPPIKKGLGRRKRKPGRPKGFKVNAITKSKSPSLAVSEVTSPKRIKLEESPLPPLEEKEEDTDIAAADKIEVAIPSPEPSMVANGFDDDHFDDAASFGDDPPNADDDPLAEDQNDLEVEIPKQEDCKPEELPSDLPQEPGPRRLRPRSEGQLAKMVEEDPEGEPKSKRSPILEPTTKKKRLGRPPLPTTKPKNKMSAVNEFSYGFYMTCPDCPARYGKLFPFQDHLRKEHDKVQEPDASFCSICDKEFSSSQNLYLHLEEYHETTSLTKPYTCVYCPATFSTLQTCNLHRKNVHWIFPQELYCDLDQCPERFFSTLNLEQHHRSHLSSEDKHQVHTCEKCGWSFLNESRLRLHKLNHSLPNTNGDHQCDQCLNKYESHFVLAVHMNRAHPDPGAERLPLLGCHLDTEAANCPFYFFNEKQSEAHRNVHAVYKKSSAKFIGEKTVRCLYCSRIFRNWMTRKAHEMVCPNAPSSEKMLTTSKPFICPVDGCQYTANFRYMLELHIQKSHADKMLPCPECEVKFFQKGHLDQHVKEHEGKNFIDIRYQPPPPRKRQRPKVSKNCNGDSSVDLLQSLSKPGQLAIKCPHCRQSFPTLLPFQEHISMTHTRKPDYCRCATCMKRFENSWSLYVHIDGEHEDPEDKPHVCIYCPESFTTPQLCELHRRDHHWMYPRDLLCDLEECSTKCGSLEELQDHHKSHSSKVLICDKCRLSFFSSSRLGIHRLNHSEKNPDGQYTCDLCPVSNQEFPTMSALARHFLGAHTSTSGPEDNLSLLYCDISELCAAFFVNQKGLEAHKILHSLYDRNTIAMICHCIYCRQKFADKTERDSHESACPSGPSAEKRDRAALSQKLACGHCDFTTKIRNSLERHQSLHLEPMYKCPQCPGRFHRKDHLKTHIGRIHNKNSSLVCHICARVCPTQPDLTYHLTEHEMPHLCPICGKKCSRAWLLKIHMRSHTGERMMCEWCPQIFPTVPQIKAHLQRDHPEEFQSNYGGILRRRIRYRLVKKDDIIEPGSVRVKYRQYNQKLGEVDNQDKASREGEEGMQVEGVPSTDRVDDLNLTNIPVAVEPCSHSDNQINLQRL